MKPAHRHTSRVTHLITKRIEELSSTRTQAEIAARAGFASPNFLSMIKDGRTKLPVNRAVGMAKALDCDVGQFVWLVLQENLPQAVLDQIVLKNAKHLNPDGILAATVVAALVRSDVRSAKRAASQLTDLLSRAEGRLEALMSQLSELSPGR